MSNNESLSEAVSTVASQLGVVVLTAAAMLATTEMLHHAELASVPIEVGSGHNAQMAQQEPISARAEGGKESARLPEEYDIGLRMPTIAGN